MTKQIKKRLLSIVLVAIMCLGIKPNIQVFAASYDSYISGVSTISQNVYYGPSSGYYTSIGMINANETIYILGKEKGLDWYHILYHAGNKMKSGYVPTNTIRDIKNGTPHEEEYYGGYAFSNKYQTVWSCDDASTAVQVGAINAGEGVTRLYAYNNVMFIEYTTSNKVKRGYVFAPDFCYPVAPTCVGRVTANSTVSYGANPNYRFQNIGSVGVREFVAVLAASESRGIAYVEYNTNNGRKRGYMPTRNISLHGGETWRSLPDLYRCTNGNFINPTIVSMTSTQTVYAGPSTEYFKLDTVSAGTEVGYITSVNINGVGWNKIMYIPPNSNSYKAGYVRQ